MSTATEKYGDPTNGGERTVELTKAEERALLLAYDYGVEHCLNENEDREALQRAIDKLKTEIWP